MKKQLLWITCILALAACEKEIAPEPCQNPLDPNCVNYHPCNGVQPVTADFEMWDYNRALNVMIHEDSVFPPGTVLFKAKLNGAQYQWLLGKDTETVQQDYRLFVGNFPGDTNIYGTYYNTLTVWKKPNIFCYSNDVSTKTLTRKITIIRPSKMHTSGVFKVLFDGYADSNMIQIQPWDQNFATNPNANKERVDNRIFIGFKDMLKDTLLSLGGASEYYYYNSIIYLGRKNQETLPYEGTITVNPATQIIEGNYKITVIKNNTKTEKQHHFKGRKL
jgi:hypothetical protein